MRWLWLVVAIVAIGQHVDLIEQLTKFLTTIMWVFLTYIAWAGGALLCYKLVHLAIGEDK